MRTTPRMWAACFAIAIANDVLDLFVVGSIPILGDVLDLGTGIFLLPHTRWLTSLGLIELIPFADILPTWTILTTISYARDRWGPR